MKAVLVPIQSIEIMKTHFTLLISILYLVSCSSNNKKTDHEKGIGSKTNIQELVIGERIDGPANIREKANGRLRFSLNHETRVQTGLKEGEWLEVGLFIDALTKEQLESFVLFPSQKLFQNGIEIGNTIDTVELWMTDDEGTGFIAGMTHKKNIIESTIPEFRLAELVKSGKTSFQDFRAFMKALNFRSNESWTTDEIDVFFIYEDFIVDPSPMDRISLLFKNERLAAINHSRPIDLDEFKSYKIDRGFELTIIGELDKTQINELISKRNRFVNSVD
jgi:hypothetical protein